MAEIVRPMIDKVKESGKFSICEGPIRKQNIPISRFDRIKVTLLSIHAGKNGVKKFTNMLMNGQIESTIPIQTEVSEKSSILNDKIGSSETKIRKLKQELIKAKKIRGHDSS